MTMAQIGGHIALSLLAIFLAVSSPSGEALRNGALKAAGAARQ